jgi:hypothetical protein
MSTEMGEYAVGAYLRLCEKCDVIDYNARSPTTGLDGLSEIDVIGLRFSDSTAFICEVATHLDGLNYGSYGRTHERILDKLDRQREYASIVLKAFKIRKFMLWSPRVPVGTLDIALATIDGLELKINGEYTKCINRLRNLAKLSTKDCGNPFFRALQLIEHLRVSGNP